MNSFCWCVAAVGCPDLENPVNGYVERHGSRATVRCFGTSETYQIVCRDNKWIGRVENCTIGDYSYNSPWSHSLTKLLVCITLARLLLKL